MITQLKNEKKEVDIEIEKQHNDVLLSKEFELNEMESRKKINDLFSNPKYDFTEPKFDYQPYKPTKTIPDQEAQSEKNIKKVDTMGFDTKVLLKKNIGNKNRQRSAWKFIQETANQENFKPSFDTPADKGSIFSINNKDFGTFMPIKNEQPIKITNEFQSRRGDRNLGKLLEKETNMIIGNAPLEKKGNNILFGMESRRGHQFNSGNKKWMQ